MKFLVTAFEPFGGGERNSSLETLSRLPDEIALDGQRVGEIHRLLLPVVYDRCGELLRAEAEKIAPDAIVCLGQAEGRSKITPEYAALNVDYATIADNAGQLRQLTPILKNAPAAYLATLPVGAMAAAMQKKGIPAAVSFSAGTYVCNNLLYHVLHDTDGTDTVAGFIHLPLSYDNGRGTPYLPIEVLCDGIITSLCTIAEKTRFLK